MSDRNHQQIDLDVAILGGGFAGVQAAKELERAGRFSGLRVGIVNDQNYMVFQPMLPEVAGASLAPGHVVNPIRLLCRKTEAYQGRVESIDWPNRSLCFRAGEHIGPIEIRYRHLVSALGATIDLSRVPGMPEHSLQMQNVGDAMRLRATVLNRLEQANLMPTGPEKRRLLTFVVVGGGYSGVETAGQLLDLFGSVHRFYPEIDRSGIRVVLIHSRDHLLPTLSRPLGEYALKQLRKRGLEVLLGRRVRSLTARRVFLDEGEPIDTSTVVSTIGNAPHPLVGEACDQNGWESVKGRVKTDSFLRVEGEECAWAGGDCAMVPLPGGEWAPATAQFATRQGTLIGRNIVRSLRKQPLKSFSFGGLGELASIGHRTAVAEVLGLRFSGFFAWWLWRTIYLAKLPGFDRKIRVVIDWTLDLFFPREVSLLNPRFTTMLNRIYLETGDVLFEQGDPAFSFYILSDGEVEVRDGERLVKRVERGQFFGERALLEDGYWRYTCVATRPSMLVAVSGEVFKAIASGSGQLRRLFERSSLQYLSEEQLNQMLERIPDGILERRVGEIMTTETEVLRCEESIGDAVAAMRRTRYSSFPVLKEDNQVVGILYRQELYDLLQGKAVPNSMPLREVSMTTPETIAPERSVGDAFELMVRSGATKILVTGADGSLEGVLSVIDIWAWAAAEAEPV